MNLHKIIHNLSALKRNMAIEVVLEGEGIKYYLTSSGQKKKVPTVGLWAVVDLSCSERVPRSTP